MKAVNLLPNDQRGAAKVVSPAATPTTGTDVRGVDITMFAGLTMVDMINGRFVLIRGSNSFQQLQPTIHEVTLNNTKNVE